MAALLAFVGGLGTRGQRLRLEQLLGAERDGAAIVGAAADGAEDAGAELAEVVERGHGVLEH